MTWGRMSWVVIVIIAIIFGNRFSEIGKKNIHRTGKRPDKPDEAAAWFYQQRANPNGIPPEALFKAKEYIKARMAKSSRFYERESLAWRELGPGNVGGRVRAILIHPHHHNIIYIAGVAGGIWKTTNGGESWMSLDDFMANLAVCTLAMDPNNPNIMYAGTGEGYYNIDALRGAGIFKSTDGGDRWEQLASTANSQFYFINKLAHHPAQSNILLAATRNGLYRTIDCGETWTMVATGGVSATRSLDVLFHRTNPEIALAAFGSFYTDGIYRSIDGGGTWQKVTDGLPSNHGRIALASAPSNPDVFYASLTNQTDYTLLGLYKSVDAGASWNQINAGTGIDYLSYGNNGASGQGWYDHAIAVDPQNSDIIWTGGIDIYRSTNGGQTFAEKTHWYGGYGYPYIHADQHIIEFVGNSSDTILVGNDGGIFRTVNGGEQWTSLNTNLNITQFYSGASAPGTDIFYGGTQDNGTLKSSASGLMWSTVFGGDGGATAVNYNNLNIVYTEYVHLDIKKSTNGGLTWVSAVNGIENTERSERSLFIAPFIMDPTDPDILYAGTHKLYRTMNAAVSWQAISDDVTWGGAISAIAVSGLSPHTIYTGSSDGRLCRTTDGGANWMDADNGLPFGRYITRITIHPSDSSVVYATYSGYATGQHVFRTCDGGSSWTNISSNLPDIPVNAIAINPVPPYNLYVGTDLGVFESPDDGTTWLVANNGLANVVIQDLFFHTDKSGNFQLVAASHGRGMFITVSSVVPVELSQFQAENLGRIVTLEWHTESETNSVCFEIQRQSDSTGFATIGTLPAAGTSTVHQEYHFVDRKIERPGNYTYRLKQIDTNGGYSFSKQVDVDLSHAFKQLKLWPNYPNPFNATTMIRYQIPEPQHVQVKIFNVEGQLVKKILDEYQHAGIHTIPWKAGTIPSGVYLCCITANNMQQTLKVMLTK